jgi:hypothetical protein
MSEKQIPGRRRFLQALVAAPLAGIVGGKIIAEEIVKASSSPMGPAWLANTPSGKYGATTAGYGVMPEAQTAISALRNAISERGAIRQNINRRMVDTGACAHDNLIALRSVSPTARRVMHRRLETEQHIARETRWLDERIADLRKQCDPLDLLSIIDGGA